MYFRPFISVFFPINPPPSLLSVSVADFPSATTSTADISDLVSAPATQSLPSLFFGRNGSDLDVGPLLSEHHADGVDVLCLAHERCGDVVHLVHQPELLEVVDVLQKEKRKKSVTNKREGIGGTAAACEQTELGKAESGLIEHSGMAQAAGSMPWFRACRVQYGRRHP